MCSIITNKKMPPPPIMSRDKENNRQLPCFPSLDTVTAFDPNKRSLTERLDLSVNCSDEKKFKIWLKPRKQSLHPKREKVTTSFQGPIKLDSEGLPLQLSRANHGVSSVNILSTPKSNTSKACVFPVLTFLTDTRELPAVKLQPRIHPRTFFSAHTASVNSRNIEKIKYVPSLTNTPQSPNMNVGGGSVAKELFAITTPRAYYD